ncbi:MAG: nucleotide exchange factor GrpE [Burkholderiaceae bacterium]|nr:nucleotide exchange factor GrpE [Burkholderiaceae bacterium]
MSDPQSETPQPPIPETVATADFAAEAPELDLAQRLALAEAKAAEYFDQFVRARAEMENVRKRAQEDVSKANKFAIESFAESLLPVRDSLEMALAVASPSMESLREGVTATLRQLVSALEKNRVIEINPAGEKFDPNRHQAIATVPAASTQPPVPANHVVAVLQKGYLINERVLRPALVSVAQG